MGRDRERERERGQERITARERERERERYVTRISVPKGAAFSPTAREPEEDAHDDETLKDNGQVP